MQDVVYLGPAPANESCAQMGEPDFDARNKAECLAYIKAIKRVCGEPPDGAVLRTNRNLHVWGTYLDVVVQFDNQNKLAVDYAFKCEDRVPLSWAEAGMEAPVVAKRDR